MNQQFQGPRVVGITGRKFNGKDTTALILCKKYGYQQLSFAGPLKSLCQVVFGFTNEQVHGNLKETPDDNWYGLTPRQVLQFVGTNMFRDHMSELDQNFGQNFWLICAQKYMETIWKRDPTAHFVISDVRFHNEVDFVKNLGGVVLRVKREAANSTVIDPHISEQLIDTFDNIDYDIKNDGTLNDLNDTIERIFQEMVEINVVNQLMSNMRKMEI